MKDSIGVFDSGIGGLTVVKEIIKTLPNENIIYLGDTARVPYGTRGNDVIEKFALEMVNFLLSKKVKFLVIACNTISAVCFEKIVAVSPVPVLGVINSTVDCAVKSTKNNIIGVIGTKATIGSGIYKTKIKKHNSQTKVITTSCPLFVPLVEEGLADHPATKLIAKSYLKEFKNSKIDTLILGCTHYPILAKTIKQEIGDQINLIDSAKPTAEALKIALKAKGLFNNKNSKGKLEIHVTDFPQRVQILAEQFLGDTLSGKIKEATLTNP